MDGDRGMDAIDVRVPMSESLIRNIVLLSVVSGSWWYTADAMLRSS